MKKYAVIGNPVEHSLSPKLHNYWIKKHKINAFYEKYLLKENDLKDIISKIKSGKLEGINITVPFKKSIIPIFFLLLVFLDVKMKKILLTFLILPNFNKTFSNKLQIFSTLSK